MPEQASLKRAICPSCEVHAKYRGRRPQSSATVVKDWMQHEKYYYGSRGIDEDRDNVSESSGCRTKKIIKMET